MRTVIHSPPLAAPEIEVQPRPQGVKFDPPQRKPTKFKLIAPKLWKKPAAAICAIENCSPSTAKRILRNGEISLQLGIAILVELSKPID